MTSPSGTRRFLYDGDRLISEYDAAGTIIGNYTHGPGPDEPLLSWEAANNYATRYFHADHQGSVVAAADDAGNLVKINAYDPWGVPNATNTGRFGYAGQTWVPELGMWYYKARIYSPMLGRFLQTDPVGYKDQVNLYAYVGNDPVDGRDPTGTQIEIREDGRRIVYVVPEKTYQKVVRDHGPDSTGGTKFRVTPTRDDLTRYVRNVVKSASVTGRVETKPDAPNGQARGTAYTGPAERFWGSTNKITSALNLMRGVGSNGEMNGRVITVDLNRIGDPILRGQAEAMANAAARVADAVTGHRSNAPLEVRVVVNVYPVKE